MAKVFISYRRDDSSGFAGRLFDSLSRHFGRDNVFMDVDAIGGGADFVATLEEAVRSCNALVVLIGKHWLETRDAHGKRRLDSAEDFVRREVATALQGVGTVIPVLVDGAGMPAADDLPEELAALARRNAVELTNTRWDYDVERLVAAIEAAGVDRVGPSRWRRLLVPVAAAVVLVAAGLGYLGWRSRPAATGAGSDQPAPVEEVVIRPSVAVLGLRNLSGRDDDAWLSTGVAEMLTTELGAGDQVRTVAGDRVSAAQLAGGLDGTKELAAEQLKRLRQALGADAVVAGSYSLVGEGDTALLRLDLRLYDAVTGETMIPVEATGTKQQLFDLVDRAGATMREKLGVAKLSAEQALQVKGSYPAGVEVMRLYFSAVDRLRRYDLRGAVDLIGKAIAIEPDHPLPRRALAEALNAQGYSAQASAEVKRALEHAGSLAETDRRFIEGRALAFGGDYAAAAKVFDGLYRAHPDDVDLGLQLAYVDIRGGQARKAVATLDRLAALGSPAAGDPRIDLTRAKALRLLGDPEAARTAATAAFEKARAAGSTLLVAEALKMLAALDESTGDLDGAARRIDEARQSFESLGDRLGVADCLFLNARVVSGRGDLDGAMRLADRSLTIYQDLGDRGGEAIVLGAKASWELDRGRLDEAQRLNEKALAVAQELGDKDRIAAMYNEFGYNLHQRGELKAALPRYQQAVAIYSELGQRRELGMALTNVAEIQYLLGNLDQAQSMHEEVLAIDRELGDRSGAAYDTVQLALVHAARGDLYVARAKLEEALKAQTELGEEVSAAETRTRLAEVALGEGKAAEAESLARQAEQVLRAEGAADQAILAQTVLARALMAQGKSGEAAAASAKADEAARSSQDRQVRLAAAILAWRVKAGSDRAATDSALAELRRVAEDAEKAGLVAATLEARLAAAEIEHRAGRSAGRTNLEAVRRDADAKGMGLIASRVAAALGT